MERDNFEEQLSKIITQADQKSNNSSNRERVWANIDKRNFSIKSWYFAAAVIFILGLSITLILNKNPDKSWIKKEKVLSRIIKNGVTQPKQFQTVEKTIDTDSLSLGKSVRSKQNNSLKIVNFSDTLMAKNSEKQIDLKSPIKNEVVTAAQKIAETKIIINESPISQPEFTVQFKRGKQIETTVENQIKIATTFKKLSFGHDTSTLVLANAKPNNPFKIKF